MKRVLLASTAIAAAISASALDSGDVLKAVFDGASKSAVSSKTLGVFAPAPKPGKPRPVDELLRARERVGNEAQSKLLASKNPQPKASFTLAVIGDAEPGRFVWERAFSPGAHAYERLIDRIKDDAPDLIFQLGDMVSKGTEANYRARVKYLDENAGIPLFSVVGNHDRSSPNGAADKSLYQKVFGPGDFFVDYNGWRLVALDTADRRLRSEQVEWLKSVLIPIRRLMIFTHVPPSYLKGKLNTCNVPALEKQKPPKEGYVHDVLTAYFDENAREFDDLMAERHVERVYFGHIHAFGTALHRGTRYVLSGGGGSPLYPLPPTEPQCLFAHYIRVKLGPGAIDETVHTLDGREFPLR